MEVRNIGSAVTNVRIQLAPFLDFHGVPDIPTIWEQSDYQVIQVELSLNHKGSSDYTAKIAFTDSEGVNGEQIVSATSI